MTGMKRFGESRREAATQLPLASPSTCPLPTTTIEVTPENASAPNPDRAAATGGERARARAIRAGVRGEGFREIKGVIVLSLAAVPAPATVARALDHLLDGVLAARGAMVAVPLSVRHPVGYATDGKRMVSVQDTARESATISILDPLPLLSLRKEEGRDVPQGELIAPVEERGQIHRIPTVTRTSLSWILQVGCAGPMQVRQRL